MLPTPCVAARPNTDDKTDDEVKARAVTFDAAIAIKQDDTDLKDKSTIAGQTKLLEMVQPQALVVTMGRWAC